MRGRVISDISEFAPENLTGNPDDLGIVATDGEVFATADGHYWLKTPNGWYEFLMGEPRWNDLRVPASSLSIGQGANNAPTWSTVAGYGSLRFLMFAGTGITEAFFNVQLPHNWIRDTAIKPHLHIMDTSTDTGATSWFLEYSWGNVMSVMPAPTTIQPVSSSGSGVIGRQHIVPFPPISQVNMLESSMLICRVYRDGSDAHNNNLALLEMDIHYQSYGVGTREEIPS